MFNHTFIRNGRSVFRSFHNSRLHSPIYRLMLPHMCVKCSLSVHKWLLAETISAKFSFLFEMKSGCPVDKGFSGKCNMKGQNVISKIIRYIRSFLHETQSTLFNNQLTITFAITLLYYRTYHKNLLYDIHIATGEIKQSGIIRHESREHRISFIVASVSSDSLIFQIR